AAAHARAAPRRLPPGAVAPLVPGSCLSPMSRSVGPCLRSDGPRTRPTLAPPRCVVLRGGPRRWACGPGARLRPWRRMVRVIELFANSLWNCYQPCTVDHDPGSLQPPEMIGSADHLLHVHLQLLRLVGIRPTLHEAAGCVAAASSPPGVGLAGLSEGPGRQ